MGLKATIFVVATAVAFGTAPNWLHLPSPGFGLVQPIPDDRLPSPVSVQEFCGGRGVDDLHNVTRVFEGRIHGAETVAIERGTGRIALVDASNYLYIGLPTHKNGGSSSSSTSGADGGYEMQGGGPITYLGPGRSMGLQFGADGSLVVCDSVKGLVTVDKSGTSVALPARTVSADSALQPGTRIGFANDLDIAQDGTVYFSESSLITPPYEASSQDFIMMEAYLMTTFKGEASGRLLRYQPADGSVHTLLEGLWFANGVALSADEDYVVVAETNVMRLHRVWLKGPKAGTSEVMVRDLPGYPDGISRASDGSFWVSLVAPPAPAAAQQAMRSRLLRLALAWLPWMRPPPDAWGAVLKVSPDGSVLDCLLDSDGSHVSFTSSVQEQQLPQQAAPGGGSRLWLGNLPGGYVSYIDLGGRSAAAAEAA